MAKLYLKYVISAILFAGSFADHIYNCVATVADIEEAEQKLASMKEMGGTENHKKRVKDEIERLRKELRANCEVPTPAPTNFPTLEPTPAPTNYDCTELFSQASLLDSEIAELKGDKDTTEEMRKAKKDEFNALKLLIKSNCGSPTLMPSPAPTVFTCPNIETNIQKKMTEFDELKGMDDMTEERKMKKEEIDELIAMFKSMGCVSPTPAPTSAECVDALAAFKELAPTVDHVFADKRAAKKKELAKLKRKIKEDCLDMVSDKALMKMSLLRG